MTIIYVLRLQRGKYYVGKTENPQRRFQEHKSGNGSAWTRKYEPIAIHKLVHTASPFEEDKVTKEMMAKYGIDNVRGGSYVTEELDEVQEEALRREIWGAQDRCTRCGREGHFVKDCYATTDVDGNEFEEESEDDSIGEVVYVAKRPSVPMNPSSSYIPVDVDSLGHSALKTIEKPQVPIDVDSLGHSALKTIEKPQVPIDVDSPAHSVLKVVQKPMVPIDPFSSYNPATWGGHKPSAVPSFDYSKIQGVSPLQPIKKTVQKKPEVSSGYSVKVIVQKKPEVGAQHSTKVVFQKKPEVFGWERPTAKPVKKKVEGY